MGPDHREHRGVWRGRRRGRSARKAAKLLLGARRVERLKKLRRIAQGGPPLAHAHGIGRDKYFERGNLHRLGKIQNPKSSRALSTNAGGAHGLDTVATGKDADRKTMIPKANVLGGFACDARRTATHAHDAGPASSTSGQLPGHTAYEGGAVYARPKAGELQITRALRMEVERHRHIRRHRGSPASRKGIFRSCASRACRNGPKMFMAGIHALNGGRHPRKYGLGRQFVRRT